MSTDSPSSPSGPPAPVSSPPSSVGVLEPGWDRDLGPTQVDALAGAAACFPGPLCDRCLGRLVGRLEPRDRPLEKGAWIREQIGLAAPPPETGCGWCEGFFTETDHFARRAVERLSTVEHETFLIATRMHPDVTRHEHQAQEVLETAGVASFEPLKMEFNRIVGALVCEELGKGVDLKRPDAIAQIDPYFDEVSVSTSSLYIYGRYRKFDRTIPQTRWPCRSCKGTGCERCARTGQQYQDSVESLVSTVALKAFDAQNSSFHGAGREDIDALMLGTGRPFILELNEPRWRRPRGSDPGTVLGLQELQVRINEHAAVRVDVLDLRWSEKAEVARVKNATPDKAYRAHVVAERPIRRDALLQAIDQIVGTEIDQRTPIRVAHRRADKVRKRKVHTVQIAGFGKHETTATKEVPEDAPGSADRFTLDIRAASGTYIKELVSGDEGRTVPSFADLLEAPMRVEALDVVSVGNPLAEEASSADA